MLLDLTTPIPLTPPPPPPPPPPSSSSSSSAPVDTPDTPPTSPPTTPLPSFTPWVAPGAPGPYPCPYPCPQPSDAPPCSKPPPPISIVSVRASPPDDDDDALTSPVTPTALSCATDRLPRRCRNEPAVVACASGQVRRMRSVLDMRLGTLSAPVDVAAALDAIDLGRCGGGDGDGDVRRGEEALVAEGDGEREEEDVKLAVELLRTLNVDSPGVGTACANGDGDGDVRRRLCWRHDGDDDIFGDAQRHDREVDLFGIPIPNAKDREDAAAAQREHSLYGMSAPVDGACSVLLAESPSRLDLSALLC